MTPAAFRLNRTTLLFVLLLLALTLPSRLFRIDRAINIKQA